jgi:uncharacterized damage-inducible protein DinB
MEACSQDQAIRTLEEGQSALDALFARLSDEEMTRPATIGGTGWSAKDLLGHIAFWEELAFDAVDDWRNGRRPAVLDIFGPGTDAANARNQERTAAQSLAEVRDRARVAHRRVLDAIRGLTAEEWQAELPSAGGAADKTLGGLLGGVLGMRRRPFGHAFAHLADHAGYVESG